MAFKSVQTAGGAGSGSQTCVIEMQRQSSSPPVVIGFDHYKQGKHTDREAWSPPPAATVVLQKWNKPRENMWRVFGTFYSFVILGMNDGAYGALIPYLESYYNISYLTISLVFLSPVVGYVGSSLLNNWMHERFGQRGVAIVATLSHVIAYVVISVHPPYPALVVIFCIAGLGNGLMDSAWNAWMGDMVDANEVLGFLHAFYGLGAAISPLIATALVTRASWHWYQYYYIMIGAAVIEVTALSAAFWTATGKAYAAEHPARVQEPSTPEEGLVQQGTSRRARFRKSTAAIKSNSPLLEATGMKVTWLCALFLLVYVGIEVSVGGWIVTFMLRVRHGNPFASGMVSTGFWLGLTAGRMILGFVTPRLFKTEKHAIATYLILTVGLEILFWLIPQFIVSAVMVSFIGFFLGPLFPAAIVAATKLLPKRLHVPAIGFAAAIGASGACVLPFAVGAIAQARGVQVLQPIVLALLVVCLGIWLCIPKLPKIRQE